MYVVNFYTSELLPHVFKGALLTFFTMPPPPPNLQTAKTRTPVNFVFDSGESNT